MLVIPSLRSRDVKYDSRWYALSQKRLCTYASEEAKGTRTGARGPERGGRDTGVYWGGREKQVEER